MEIRNEPFQNFRGRVQTEFAEGKKSVDHLRRNRKRPYVHPKDTLTGTEGFSNPHWKRKINKKMAADFGTPASKRNSRKKKFKGKKDREIKNTRSLKSSSKEERTNQVLGL